MFNTLSRIGLSLTSLLLILLMAPLSGGHLLAQTNTPIPPPSKPLPFNQIVSGQLRGKGEKITYTFDVPIDQDVIFEYRANKLVFSDYCILIDQSTPNGEHCEYMGGSGGDRAFTNFHLIATLGQKGQRATVTLTRVLDGAASYQITAYPITAQATALGNSDHFNPTDSQPFQVYTINADPIVPFTVEIEDEAVDGNFLWAAYHPYSFESFPIFDKQLFLPEYIDGAVRENGVVGINQLRLYYLGGRTFRVLVKSAKSYALYSADAALSVLDENQKINMTVSYRQPILVTRLNIQPGEHAQVNFNVTVGSGAIVRVYEAGNPVDEGLSLGSTGTGGPTFALSNNVQRTAIKALYVVVQIPFEYTRDKVDIEVTWQHVK